MKPRTSQKDVRCCAASNRWGTANVGSARSRNAPKLMHRTASVPHRRMRVPCACTHRPRPTTRASRAPGTVRHSRSRSPTSGQRTGRAQIRCERIPQWLVFVGSVCEAPSINFVQMPDGETHKGRQSGRLIGRAAESLKLREFVEAIQRTRTSRVLVLHGVPGAGKSALLEHVADLAAGCRVLRSVGVQSEMEIPFSGLHLLCGSMLRHLDSLPLPQRDALRTVFGLSTAPPPDRLLIGLAVLGLLSHGAEKRALVCLVDDYQWLDRASAQVLAFVARRLGADSVGLVFATRRPQDDLAGLPMFPVQNLPEAEASELLKSALTSPLDAQVCGQILAEARGNPLALLELPRSLMPAGAAGGFGLPGAVSLAGGIQESFRRRVSAVPDGPRRLLLLAAADPTGDAPLVWRAAARLGLDTGSATPLSDAGLVEFGTRVEFRHSLARSAAYQQAPARERRLAHRALAESTDERADPDRRAWHLAQAATGPDEHVAAALERSAARAGERGGFAAAAAFLQRAATLTLDPAKWSARALAAARAKIEAGTLDGLDNLLEVAGAGTASPLQRATADMLRARAAFIRNRGGEAPALLLRAAKTLEPNDVELCRATYLDAMSAAIFTGRMAAPGSGVRDVARAAATAPAAPRPRSSDLLLEALVVYFDQGPEPAMPRLRRALDAFGHDLSTDEELRLLWLASVAAALRTWDYDRWDDLSARHVRAARGSGALGELPLALTSRACVTLFAGDLSAAAVLVDEIQSIQEITGGELTSYAAFILAAFRGEEATTTTMTQAAVADAGLRGEGTGEVFAEWANALLHNGLGRYAAALSETQRACALNDDPGTLIWILPEMIEAASRTGQAEVAERACARLAGLVGEGDWGTGVLKRSRALSAEGDAADRLYREAIDHLGRTRLRVDCARAHLLYGEWLRRERRQGEAREHLRAAHAAFSSMGVMGFAERARSELLATGETPRRHTGSPRSPVLTAQEARIARLARDGLSNPEIGARLFISTHTVQYHLRKVFAKLGITSRSQLDRALPAEAGKDGW